MNERDSAIADIRVNVYNWLVYETELSTVK